jgi:hypothetical protein
MSNLDYCQQFGNVFGLELHAVECRRRRLRIEGSLGFLPGLPVQVPGDENIPAEAMAQNVIRAQLEAQHKLVEEAWIALAEARRTYGAMMHHDPHGATIDHDPAEPPDATAVVNAARHYYEVAKHWYDLADGYGTASWEQFRREPDERDTDARRNWEEGEAILRVASQALAHATEELRREKPKPLRGEQQAQNAQAAAQDAQAAAQAGEILNSLYGSLLLREMKVQKPLEALAATQERKSQLMRQLAKSSPEADPEVAPELQQPQANPEVVLVLWVTEFTILEIRSKLLEEQYELARAEQALFEKAATILPDAERRMDCAMVADATLEEVQHRRRAWQDLLSGRQTADSLPGPEATPLGDISGNGLADGELPQKRNQALRLDIVGLCLSGGGIRSATFGLGVLQGLAQLRLLGMVDYLSTVSGGGYIGSWLSAWIWREGSVLNVEKQLSPNRISEARAERYAWDGETRLDDRPRDAEPEPVHHLRAYSRYLSPRYGVFELDTWTLFSIYFRNLFVNALFFVPLALALVLLWRLLMHLYLLPIHQAKVGPFSAQATLLTLFVLAYLVASVCLAWEEENLFEANINRELRDWQDRTLAKINRKLSGVWCFRTLLRALQAERFSLTLGIRLSLFFVALIGPWIFSLDPLQNRDHEYANATQLRYYEAEWRPKWFGDLNVLTQFVIGAGVVVLPVIVVQVVRWDIRAGVCGRSIRWRGSIAIAALAVCLGAVFYGVFSWRPSWFFDRNVLTQFLIATGVFVLLLIVVQVVRRVVSGQGMAFNCRGSIAIVALAVCLGVVFYGVLYWFIWPCSFNAFEKDGWAKGELTHPEYLILLHSFGVPLMLVGVVGAGFVEMGLLSRMMSEYQREWRSRLGASLLMLATAWLLTATAIYLLPWGVEWLSEFLRYNVSNKDWAAALQAVLAAAWAAISGSGAWIASRTPTNGATKQPTLLARTVMAIAPAVFLLGLLASISMLSQTLCNWLDPAKDQKQIGSSMVLFQATQHRVLGFWLMICAFLAAALVGWSINVNRFSLHMLYANRLTRCYIGASCRKQGQGSLGTPTGVHLPRAQRVPNQFTGFDPWDDLPIAELRTVRDPVGLRGAGQADAPQTQRTLTPYTGPVPLINCALSCLAGDELAHQDRRADAFVLSPGWCGSRLTGYAQAPTELWMAEHVSLGRAMTISGAAFDPNMAGLSSSLTALMTVLNTRLGWWIENLNPQLWPWRPWRDRPWTRAQPSLSVQLVREFFGRTNESKPFIHLTDGGHFENLGVYELIRRRCRFIIVADAGTDRVAASDNMAAMLRLIRTDFGVTIDLDPARMQLDDETTYSTWHCCVARIHYDQVDEEAVPGLMVYLQATLTGDEPPDLLQYVSRNPTFPRQSTLNQFFDEAQFEAYRTLGQHIATKVFTAAADKWSSASASTAQHQKRVRSLFSCLREDWLPPLDSTTAAWQSATEAAIQLEQQASGNRNLINMGHTLYPEVGRPPVWPRGQPDPLHEFRAVSQTLQVMETAWKGLKLDEAHAHPTNRGWINTFRRWTASPQFQRYWPFLRAEYSRAFVSFCEDILNLQPTRVDVQQLAVGAVVPIDLDEQFAVEWQDLFEALRLPTAAFPPNQYLASTMRDCVSSPLPDYTTRQHLPLAWLISQKLSLQVQRQIPPPPPPPSCGFACVARTTRQEFIEPPSAERDAEAEFFFWLTGPYRSMGVGAWAATEILDRVDGACAYTPPPGMTPPSDKRVKRLTVYYPIRDGVGCREELERWMDFYFDLGFRRTRQPERGFGSRFVILKRPVS